MHLEIPAPDKQQDDGGSRSPPRPQQEYLPARGEGIRDFLLCDFLLRDFTSAERKELPLIIDRAADAVEALLERGLATAQNEFHATQ